MRCARRFRLLRERTVPTIRTYGGRGARDSAVAAPRGAS